LSRQIPETGLIQRTLSMGHHIHVLTYDSTTETIDVKLYTAIMQENRPKHYHYKLFSNFTKGYERVTQTFKKYSDHYRWNRLDNLILDSDERAHSEGMRFRRLTFGLIPPKLNGKSEEQDYIANFKRLLEYLSRLCGESTSGLGVEIVTQDLDSCFDFDKSVRVARRGTTDTMKAFTVNLQKRKRDLYQWVELAVDSTFDTQRSYRLMFNWLVASYGKVDTQVQLLQRRCTQYGLRLVRFPEIAISRNLLLNPFTRPIIWNSGVITGNAALQTISKHGFINDGIQMTESSFLDCLDDATEFEFPRNNAGEIKSIPSAQFVHHTGTVFVRFLQDQHDNGIVFAIINNRVVEADERLFNQARTIVADLRESF